MLSFMRLFVVLLTLPYLSLCQQQQSCNESEDQICTTTSTPIATPHRQLPDDFIDPCQDSQASCSQWANEGECLNNPNFMLAQCPRSCGTCVPLHDGEEEESENAVASSVCVDDEEKCSTWADMGECAINPLFMHVKCKYSCWKCVDVKKDRAMGVDEDIIAKKLLYVKMDIGKQNQFIPKATADTFQTLKPKVKEHKKVVSTIREMEYYAKHVLTDSTTVDAKTRERCHNLDRMCADWASRGRCGYHYPYQAPTNVKVGDNNDFDDEAFNAAIKATKDDVVFMMNTCPLACRTCHELESFHKCTGRRHPHEQPLFESEEDLNTFFENKRKKIINGDIHDEWAQYEPLFVSYPDAKKVERNDDPYVVVLKKFLTDEEAEYLQSSCHDSEQCDTTNETYKRIILKIANLTNSPTSHLEPMKMFSISGEKEHNSASLHHNFEMSNFWTPAGPRVLSLSLFLSNYNKDANKGVGLGFPHLDWLQIKPEKGTAVIWPNVRGENLMEYNPLTSYEYHPLHQNGEEDSYVSNIHFRMYNWTDANMRGC